MKTEFNDWDEMLEYVESHCKDYHVKRQSDGTYKLLEWTEKKGEIANETSPVH